MMDSNTIPQDNKAYRFPVSVKGIVYQDGKVVLLKNERDEWELPGGKLELGEAPEFCVVREIDHIYEGVDVLILTYGCYPTPFSAVTHSPEHKAVGLFNPEEVKTLRMPEGYKKSIQSWLNYLDNAGIRSTGT